MYSCNSSLEYFIFSMLDAQYGALPSARNFLWPFLRERGPSNKSIPFLKWYILGKMTENRINSCHILLYNYRLNDRDTKL